MNGVITPISRVITPVFLFIRPFIGVFYPMFSTGDGAHLEESSFEVVRFHVGMKHVVPVFLLTGIFFEKPS